MKKDYKIAFWTFILLTIVNIKSTYAQEYPLVTEINGVKVVIWTLEQDKSNSIIIEKYYACDSLHSQLEKENFINIEIIKNDSLQFASLDSAFKSCENQLELQSQNNNHCSDQLEIEEQKVGSLKKQNLILKGIALLLLIAALL